jgi:Ca2+-binding EF-hand superfamily protein
VNHDGVISVGELKQALLQKNRINEERIDFLMRVIDTNSSGEIDFTEFIVAAL